jgi:protein ImuB
MFACIYARNVSKLKVPASEQTAGRSQLAPLATLAFTFSPAVEETRIDIVVLDISGQDLLFGDPFASTQALVRDEINSARNLANDIARRAAALGIKVNVSVAADPDAAIHAARSLKGITVIGIEEERLYLGSLPIQQLDYSLAGIDEKRAEEIQATFALWGIRTFQDLAALPLTGIAERLGQEGVRLQKLAQGKSDRCLNLVRPPIGFEQSLELEHAVEELEPLSFILSRLLNQLCANLHEYALATNEIQLQLTLQDKSEHQRTITLPVPMRNHKTLLRLLLFDIEAEPPQAPIVAVAIAAKPVKPRASQTGLFIPLAPEPEKLEITLARLAKLVGADKVGSPELLDTHRPDAFRMKRFSLPGHRKNNRSNPQSAIRNSQCLMGFRIFRPPWRADVQIFHGRPTRLNARSATSSASVRGKIVCASGPWRTSGDWWRADVWASDEWDVAVVDSASQDGEVLCRIFHDLTTEQWFVAGIYD